ncbi:MAG: sucrase ferredoxin [Microbacterium sp.]|uniref:sucrase ferredoxin n=1 Tax=Microbacterium sp. TaxID=51671 RepID=UPI0039E2C996
MNDAVPVQGTAWAPCSDLSRERDDPLAGTGGYGERWLLVEIDGSWGRHAFTESRLDPMIGRTLTRRAEAAGIRPVAIRRFGRRGDERRAQTRWRWMLATSRPGAESVQTGHVDDPAQLLDLPLDGTGEPSDEPLFLVCTHARHDRCCAVRGRPVAQALAAAYPAQTWECSHLGGDRFAATMILLPHGLYYGRVPPTEAGAIAEHYLQGRVVPEHLRGRSSLSTVAQAAQAAARAETGDARIGSFAPMREERTDDGWVVDLEAGDGVLEVTLRERWSEPMLSTCAATHPVRVREHEAVGIVRRGAP